MILPSKIRFNQRVALLMAFLMTFQAAFPLGVYALTSGPTQPELQSFEPVGTTEMVNLFSGDFTYNIPLLEVPGPDGGYPINLFYNSVTEGETEASMVGLGWNIGVGSITRSLRGLPDDFDGELIRKKVDMKENWTAGIGLATPIQIFGADSKKLLSANLNLGMNIMYNSYKGVGYSFDPGIGVNMGTKGNGGVGLSSSFGFSVNSLEGVSANANVSLTKTREIEGEEANAVSSSGFGIGMSSREGLKGITLNQRMSKTKTIEQENKTKDPDSAGKSNSSDDKGTTTPKTITYDVNSIASSVNILPEHSSVTPQVKMPFSGSNLMANIRLGGGFLGFHPNAQLSGFYSTQRLINKGKWDTKKAYGNHYLQNAGDQTGLMDFNREKDLDLVENQPNLAIPVNTPDLLSVTGHGIGGMHQAYRSDIGVYKDHLTNSTSAGGSIGFEVGVPSHAGIDINLNFARHSDNQISSPSGFGFFSKQIDDPNLFEPFYYKTSGEMTAETKTRSLHADEYIGMDEPIRLNRSGMGFGSYLENRTGINTYQNINAGIGKRSKRKPRTSTIQSYTNEDLVRAINTFGGTTLAIKEFKVDYYDGTGIQTEAGGAGVIDDYTALAKKQFVRPISNRVDRHKVGGYSQLTPSGAKWNFGLPAMNTIQREVAFSVLPVSKPSSSSACDPIVDVKRKGGTCSSYDVDYKVSEMPNGVASSNDYLDITETPAYAHSYLLTSILGANYIDSSNDGPTDDDMGYWMKVEYVQTSDALSPAPYKWRSPFVGANYLEGFKSKGDDDKAHFIYGERDQYYPARILTKTHCADFYYSQREDARGASCWLQNSGDSDAQKLGARSFKLDSIKLYSKLAGVNQPIKTVVFEYATGGTEELCLNPDNATAGRGKLTLKKVYFTYENNRRGELTPYEFSYFNEGSMQYEYNRFAFDRWGNYRYDANAPCLNSNSPYVDQSPASESQLESDIRAYHLSQIRLPSGSNIILDIGRDHYGYVQDRVATQMFKISGFDDTGTNEIAKDANPSAQDRRVYFDLEYPIPVGVDADRELDRYFEDLHTTARGKQIFFKQKVDLFDDSSIKEEEISGYADIENWGFAQASNGQYEKAYVELKPFPIKIKGDEYHPMLVNNWQFIKVNLPDQMFGYTPQAQPGSNDDRERVMRQLLSVWNELGGLFKNYYRVCKSRNYGRKIDLTQSFIRLNSPDKKKYGGGVRVNKIVLDDDHWTEEETPKYGTIYEYETEELEYNPLNNDFEPTGRMISSGVAANEPAVGNEESALKYAKQYTKDFKLRTNQIRTFEYPVNESYYPSASVGYSKVTVKSLASAYAINENNGVSPPSTDLTNLPMGFATSGLVVNEFYTAKDFPVITKETTNNDKTNPIKLLFIPFIGQRSEKLYTGSQGYTIELNNMHGQPFKKTSYALDVMGGIVPEPVSWVRYDYQHEEEIITEGGKQRLIKKLNNEVDVVAGDQTAGSTTADIQEAEMGVERQVFMDMRESESRSTTGGWDLNDDVIGLGFLGFHVPVPWKEIGLSHERVRTTVTNKVIRKVGILKKVVASDGQSIVETENKLFNPITGQPVLATVNNSFDDPVYNYQIPAHLVYDQMGPAYQNIGLSFSSVFQHEEECFEKLNRLEVPVELRSKLVEGDRFIIKELAPPGVLAKVPYKAEARLVRIVEDEFYFSIPDKGLIDNEESVIVELIQSGRKNLLGAQAGTVIALEDPTINRLGQSCSVDTRLPDNTNNPIPVFYSTVNGVLSTSATTYKDIWPIDQPCGEAASGGQLVPEPYATPYKDGVKGIWRPYQSFAFVGDRNYDAATPFEQRGKIDQFPLFNWYNPFYTQCDATDGWKLTEEITAYANNGAATESKNILNIYSAVLYGYNENLTIGVGLNSRKYELGFESFEEHPLGPLDNFTPSGNIYISCDDGAFAQTRALTQTYDIVGSYDGGDRIIIDRPFDGVGITESVILELAAVSGDVDYYDGIRISSVQNSGGNTELTLEAVDPGACKLISPDCAGCPNYLSYGGRAHIQLCRGLGSPCQSGETFISDAEAHTGKQSFHVTQNSQFAMGGLYLTPGKKYVLGAWVKRPTVVSHTYQDPSKPLGIELIQNGVPTFFQPEGPIIDGWQRIEGVVDLTGAAATVEMKFVVASGTALPEDAAYFDDLRIFPEKGNIQTYVYDPKTYRLTEILDNNNYFSRYLYDNEGQLIGVLKETHEGIKSIQESGSFIHAAN